MSREPTTHSAHTQEKGKVERQETRESKGIEIGKKQRKRIIRKEKVILFIIIVQHIQEVLPLPTHTLLGTLMVPSRPVILVDSSSSKP